jgi:hypothetical protein
MFRGWFISFSKYLIFLIASINAPLIVHSLDQELLANADLEFAISYIAN